MLDRMWAVVRSAPLAVVLGVAMTLAIGTLAVALVSENRDHRRYLRRLQWERERLARERDALKGFK